MTAFWEPGCRWIRLAQGAEYDGDSAPGTFHTTGLSIAVSIVAWVTPPCFAGDPEVAKDNEVLESIMTIVSDRAAVSKPAGGGGGGGAASEAAASFLSGLGGGADDHASGRSSRDRDRDRDRYQPHSSTHTYVNPSPVVGHALPSGVTCIGHDFGWSIS